MFNIRKMMASFWGSTINLPPSEGWVRQTDWLLGVPIRTASGYDVTPAKSLTLSTYFRCLANISDDVSKMPVEVYETTVNPGTGAKSKINQHDHDVVAVMKRPNPHMSGESFIKSTQAQALGWGGGFAEIQRVGNKPAALWPIHASRVSWALLESGERIYKIRNNDGSSSMLEEMDMFHIHGMGSDGYGGYGLSVLAKEAIGLSLSAEKFGSKFFDNGAVPGGLIQLPPGTKLKTDDDRKRYRDNWNMSYASAENAHKMAVLDDGATFKELSIPPDQAQFLETRTFQVEEICRWFRMPPHKAQHMIKATLNNIVQQNLEYVIDCLATWINIWEEEIWWKLIRPSERATHHARFKMTALLRGDPVTQATYYKNMIQGTVMSPNEARSEMELNDYGESGDELMIQVNMTTLDKLVEADPAAGSMPGDEGEDQNPDQAEPEGIEGEEPSKALSDSEQFQDKKPGADAFLPVLEAMFFRLARKESIALSRGKRDAAWADKFYASLGEDFTAQMTPIYATLLAISPGLKKIPAGDLAKEYLEAHKAKKADATREAAVEAKNLLRRISE